MEVKTIAVIGAGTMGRGIAYAAAFGGYRTILEDITQSMLDAGLDYIRTSLDDAVTRGKLTADQRDRAFAQLGSAHSVEEACREADIVIEAVPEHSRAALFHNRHRSHLLRHRISMDAGRAFWRHG